MFTESADPRPDRETLRTYAGRYRFGTTIDPSIQLIVVVENRALTRLTFEQAGRLYETVKRR